MKPVGVNSFWKMCYAIRLMMDNWPKELPFLSSIIEMAEKFIGGNPELKIHSLIKVLVCSNNFAELKFTIFLTWQTVLMISSIVPQW
jgi:hypothetical protein